MLHGTNQNAARTTTARVQVVHTHTVERNWFTHPATARAAGSALTTGNRHQTIAPDQTRGSGSEASRGASEVGLACTGAAGSGRR